MRDEGINSVCVCVCVCLHSWILGEVPMGASWEWAGGADCGELKGFL